MIRTLSKALSNTSSSSTESSPPQSNSRRFTFDSFARRLSDSKKGFLEQIPRHQQQLTRLRKRARSLLPSSLINQLEFDKRNSSDGVCKQKKH
jgi:TolA-binding protein